MKNLRWTGMVATAAILSACTVEDGTEGNDPPVVPTETEPEVTAVEFEDAEFEACVREAIGMFNVELWPENLAPVLHLSCQDRQITSIVGIEHMTGLTELSLWENEVSDLTPLAELVNLTHLQLGNNAIEDLWPLAELTNLQRLGLSINFIWDSTPLAGLLELRWLNLDVNQLGDIAPIGTLPNLQWLTVDHNPIGQHPTVGELEGRGVTVYADYADAAPHTAESHHTAPNIFGYVGGGELREAGRPALRVRSDGAIDLGFAVDGLHYDVIPEFGGSLEVVEGLVHYRTVSRDVVVGAMGDSGPEICTGAYADVCTLSIGAKATGAARSPEARASAPVFTAALTLTDSYDRFVLSDDEIAKPMNDAVPYGAINADLLPYVLASPNQADAGTCLFMASTGTMEILMNQHTPLEAIQYGGDTDLSERFLMNGSDFVGSNDIRWVLSDLTYAYNKLGGSMLDRDYPFIAGCMTEAQNIVDCSNPEAYYLTMYANWQNDLPTGWEEMLVPTPEVERTSIFIDPNRDDNSYWRVGLMDDSVVDKIKYELRTKRAPVIVVYNHFLYWHADIIVGYDDTVETGGCPMVDQSVDYYREQGADTYAAKIEQRQSELGGCWNTGKFLVRDSIYDGGADEPEYTYGGYPHKDKYSKRIVERTYNWVRFLANHAYTVHRK